MTIEAMQKSLERFLTRYLSAAPLDFYKKRIEYYGWEGALAWFCISLLYLSMVCVPSSVFASLIIFFCGVGLMVPFLHKLYAKIAEPDSNFNNTSTFWGHCLRLIIFMTGLSFILASFSLPIPFLLGFIADIGLGAIYGFPYLILISIGLSIVGMLVFGIITLINSEVEPFGFLGGDSTAEDWLKYSCAWACVSSLCFVCFGMPIFLGDLISFYAVPVSPIAFVVVNILLLFSMACICAYIYSRFLGGSLSKIDEVGIRVFDGSAYYAYCSNIKSLYAQSYCSNNRSNHSNNSNVQQEGFGFTQQTAPPTTR